MDGTQQILCNSNFKPTAKGIAKNPIHVLERENALHATGKKQKSVTVMQKLIAFSQQQGEPAVHQVKRANAMFKDTSEELIMAYNYLQPYLEKLEECQPTVAHKLERGENNEFRRLGFLFPYSVKALPFCFNVVGVDTAHMALVVVDGIQTFQLQEMLDRDDITDETRNVQSKLYLTIVSGRTTNNEMLIFAYCLGYAENANDVMFFFKFLKDNKFPLDTKEMTIMTDRGAAIAGSVEKSFPCALHFLCPLHILRNLQALKGGKSAEVATQFWKIQSAASKHRYDEEMRSLLKNHPTVHAYLSKIDGVWQRYAAAERGNVLYEMRSDNLVEGAFARLKDIRQRGTAPEFTFELNFLGNGNLCKQNA